MIERDSQTSKTAAPKNVKSQSTKRMVLNPSEAPPKSFQASYRPPDPDTEPIQIRVLFTSDFEASKVESIVSDTSGSCSQNTNSSSSSSGYGSTGSDQGVVLQVDYRTPGVSSGRANQ